MDAKDIKSDFSNLNAWIQDLLISMGISEQWTNYVKFVLLLALAVLIVYLLQFLVRNILTFIFKKVTKATSLSIFRYAINNRVPHYLALVVPYTFVRTVIPIIFEDFRGFISPCLKLTDIYMVFMIIWTLMSIIKSLTDVVQEKEAFRNKPFKSYLQVVQIIFYIFGAVAIFSILTGKSATTFFAAMGAASAVLMLMFKDTIMGFVSSIQLSSNDMLRIGDWITMSKYGADGTVTEINLTTVKVMNFDNTITTIPTYSLISDSFQNWRGMQESGGRRFVRSLYVNQSDITAVSDDELEKMKKVDALKEYIEQKQVALKEANDSLKTDMSVPLNGYRLTNCDLFIQYATWYLQNNHGIRQDVTLMVRTLAPTSEGLPIQLYAFTDTTALVSYENTISEIVNHLISSLKYFNLRIYTTTASDSYDIYIKDKVQISTQPNTLN
ncbi:MAG: mechanosensitive ion channel family protein [Dysgonomonas sp.]